MKKLTAVLLGMCLFVPLFALAQDAPPARHRQPGPPPGKSATTKTVVDKTSKTNKTNKANSPSSKGQTAQ